MRGSGLKGSQCLSEDLLLGHGEGALAQFMDGNPKGIVGTQIVGGFCEGREIGKEKPRFIQDLQMAEDVGDLRHLLVVIGGGEI